MELLPWIAAAAAAALLAIVSLGWFVVSRRPARLPPLPAEWTLSARPVFSTDERRVYRLIREALPHHVVLSKLPLVRFSQPNDPGQVRYWYELLGAIHVTFAVCSANGRVLAAIDLESARGASRRTLQIKQSVLGACRVRYLRCAADSFPSIAELQLLVPNANSRTPMPSSGLDEARDSLASTVASRRAQRSALWQDSSFFQDSFFAPDSRLDGFGHSEFAPSSSGRFPRSRPGALQEADRPAATRDDDDDNDGGAVVIESDPSPTRSRS